MHTVVVALQQQPTDIFSHRILSGYDVFSFSFCIFFSTLLVVVFCISLYKTNKLLTILTTSILLALVVGVRVIFQHSHSMNIL